VIIGNRVAGRLTGVEALEGEMEDRRSPSSQITKYNRQNVASTRDRPAQILRVQPPLPGRAVHVAAQRDVRSSV